MFIIIIVLLVLIVFKLCLNYQTKWCKSKLCLIGKTTIVTGANSGIGYETALEFAKRGARVILACRNPTAAEEARETIVNLTRNENVVVKIVDMSSLSSVRMFVKNILETEERLDILVNNAGTSGLLDKNSEDGFQKLMQINYFGPFLLTYLLIDLLKKSAPSRIINVSSTMANHAKLNPDDLNFYPGMVNLYSNTKLCNILFTKELGQRLKETGVTAYSVHPGYVRTKIFKPRGIFKILYFLSSFYFKTWEEGAQTTLYASFQQNLEHLSGEHFVECEFASPYATTQVPGLSKKVWDNTIDLLKLSELN